jgi:capsular exopolysaccharide synthesis family protein
VELTQYLAVARRWWWLLIAAVVIGGGVAYYMTKDRPTTYTATTRLIVFQGADGAATGINDLNTSTRLAETFAEFVTLRPNMEAAVAAGDFNLTADQLRRRISVFNPPDTFFLDITAAAATPSDAIVIVNTVAETFVDSAAASTSIGPTASLEIVEPAIGASANVPSNTTNIVLGAIVAFIGAAAVGLIMESLDRRIRLSSDVFHRTGLPTVGQLERFRAGGSPGGQLQVVIRPTSPVAEEFRAIRTNLSSRIDFDQETAAILVASPTGGDGKTTVVANLAVVFGLAGRSVVLVDADLRNPRQHEIFGIRNDIGLTTVLNSPNTDVDRVVQRTDQPNVSLLPAGPIATNPSELLGSLRMRQVVEELRRHYDVVLLDSPPLLSVTDGTVLAGVATGSVLVLRPNKTQVEELGAAVDALAQSRHPIHGVVLNQVRGRSIRQLHAYTEDRIATEGRWRVEEPPGFAGAPRERGRTVG